MLSDQYTITHTSLLTYNKEHIKKIKFSNVFCVKLSPIEVRLSLNFHDTEISEGVEQKNV